MPQDHPPRIPVEEIAKFPPPGMSAPVSFSFSPDDSLLTYLYGEDGSPVRKLYGLDTRTGESKVIQAAAEPESDDLSIEEQLLRQRQRQLGQGIVRYSWADSGGVILIPAQSGIYVKDGPEAPARRVVSAESGPTLDPQLSPDGTQVVYVTDAEVYVAPVSGEPVEPRQLTYGARGTGKTNGLAEYISQEEMHRLHGFWWSRDGSQIAFEEVDETHIPVYRIVHQGKDDTGASAQEDHRYPFAGDPNARVRLGVVPATGGEPIWMDLGDDDDIYLARVDWMPDGSLCAQLQNREQTRLDLVRFDTSTGQGVTLLTEISDVWINLHNMFRSLKDGNFIWASERSGFRHLYLYDSNGNLVRQLTEGDWAIDTLAGVDQDAGLVYFTGTKDGPTECHLYSVPLEGGLITRLTQDAGTHIVTLDHASNRFVDTFSSTNTPPMVTLRSLQDGSALHTIHSTDDPRVDELALTPPELVSIESRDGETLHGALYRPSPEFGDGPHPTVIYTYGGPHAQVVNNHWSMTCAMRSQYLRSLGYLVFCLDNRGSARRGLEFEGVIKHNMGDIEVRDQVDGVRWLIDNGLADPDRVGVYGWSYGGFMTLMCLAKTSNVFKMGVAGAPVTHWDGYDTHYTERYMGTPQSNPDGYASGSVMTHVDSIEGDLLIVHGLIDENVHFRHTARLINALIKARKPYELMMFPDERHMPRSQADRIYMEERITDFFQRNL
ncbi:MAG: S9 family peptidase [Dehalococcoidia bacterium]|nr:S9 family peptidase [Dehalococcoidia bacterium]